MDMLRCDRGIDDWCEYDCWRTSCPVCANGWCGGDSGREGVVTGAIVGMAVPTVVGHLWSLWKVHSESAMGLGLYACAIWEGRMGGGGRRIAAVFLRFFHFARRFWNQTYKGKTWWSVGLSFQRNHSKVTFKVTDGDGDGHLVGMGDPQVSRWNAQDRLTLPLYQGDTVVRSTSFWLIPYPHRFKMIYIYIFLKAQVNADLPNPV